MAREPANIVLTMPPEIRAKQDDHSGRFDAIENRLKVLALRVEELHVTATYSLGHSTDTQLRQSKQGVRIDELFAKVEKLLTEGAP
jgi:hypothetical protein